MAQKSQMEQEIYVEQDSQMVPREFWEQLLLQKDVQIRKLKAENEKLRQQNKEARKKVRDLEKKIQVFDRSRWNRLGNVLRKIRFRLISAIKFPFRGVRKIYRLLFVKDVAMQNNELQTQINVPKSKRELQYPQMNGMYREELFAIDGKITTVTVVVCIHNAIYDVEECLLALWDKRTYPYEIILVDDGSDEETRNYVLKFAEITGAKLIRNEEALGYTRSANKGLRAATGDYIILLNSDTIVTEGWVEKMVTCFRKNAKAGIVSPLSNAASYQSVPEIHDFETGTWKINRLAPGITLEMMGQIVEMASEHSYPQVSVLNGFCFMISRSVIDTIGYLDEENFPRGYGEEVDYCLRAREAGFELCVADDVYIFHEKTKSFTSKTRKKLSEASKDILINKHGFRYSNLDFAMEHCDELKKIRKQVANKQNEIMDMGIFNKKIAFLLTARGGSGGANSVCQEVMGMRRLGVNAYVINSHNYKVEFEKNYPELIPYVKYFDKKSEKSLLDVSLEFDIIIGTIFTTIKSIKLISETYKEKKFGYYIQDYEPLFFDEREDYWKEAKDSYTLLDDICMFAKTRWIGDTVEREHGRKVNIVEPSIDIAMYNPYVIEEKDLSFPIRITAMIRPKTERRNPVGTLNVMKMLKEKYDDQVEIHFFGCTEDEIVALGEAARFEYTNHGILKRWEVAALLAKSHMFLDMSTYQAFGRTGLESMCLGCIAIIPEEGGADKYAVDDVNAVVVDTMDEMAVYERICKLMESPEKMKIIQKNGLEAARGYGILKASMSELEVLNRYLKGQRSS